jgi:hypothetical protein
MDSLHQQYSLRFHQAVAFDRSFGYRINAMGMSQDYIIPSFSAITFPVFVAGTLPEGDPRISKRNAAVSEPDPQEAFFGAIQPVRGVFRDGRLGRTASIVEGGVRKCASLSPGIVSSGELTMSTL